MRLLRNHSLERASLIALALVSLTSGAAFANQFFVFHPNEMIPCVEAILFNAVLGVGTVQSDDALTPSSEEYLLNEVAADTEPF